MKEWTAEQWAEWAAVFIGWPKEKGSVNIFNPLHDLNHLGFVLDEIERRGWKWTLDTMCSMKEYTMELYKDGRENVDSGPWPSINLAVLLAAKALEATA